MPTETTTLIVIMGLGSILAIWFIYMAVKESQRLQTEKKPKKKKRPFA